MNRATDSVAAEFTNYRETVLVCFLLDFATDLVDAPVSLGDAQCAMEGALGALNQGAVFVGHRRHGNRDRGVAHVTVLFKCDVELHEIARRDPPSAGNSVNSLLVEAD